MSAGNDEAMPGRLHGRHRRCRRTDRAWQAQRRLHARYVHLVHAGGKAAPEAVVAVARELAGFVWAEMTA